MEDVARAIEAVEASLDQLVKDCRLVEFDVIAGEEPEEGVELEVVSEPPCPVGPPDCECQA